MFNEEKQAIPLLQSLINQDFHSKYEIIVVDNQSTDNTLKIVSDFKNKHKLDNLRIISSIGKLGKVRNDGVFEARGKWIAFIDADEVAEKNWLTELFRKTDEFDLIMGPGFSVNPNVSFISKSFALLYKKRNQIHKHKKNLKSAYTGNLLVRRKVFEDGVTFDNNLPTSEDGDFSFRAYINGYKIGYNHKAIIYHKNPETIRQLIAYQKKMAIGKLLLFTKHHSLHMILKLFTEMFYWISLNYLKAYVRNRVLSKINFTFFGMTMALVSLYCYVNPFILFNIRKKISRPK